MVFVLLVRCGIAVPSLIVLWGISQQQEPGESPASEAAVGLLAMLSAPMGFCLGLFVGGISWFFITPAPKDAE